MSTTVMYPSGSVKTTVGNWTHTGGDAAETIAVAGVVFGALISSHDSSGAYDASLKYSAAISGNVTTITFYPQATVTNGDFIIFHSG